jgi:hypothetical protein
MNIPASASQVLQVAASTSELQQGGVDLTPGRRYAARVLSVNGDQAVVNINGQNITTTSSAALRQGELVALTVGRADSGTVVLRLGRAADRGRSLLDAPQGAIVSRTDEHVSEAIRAAGLPADAQTLEAAQALLRNGLPLTEANLSYVARNASLYAGDHAEVADSLALLRALGLPASSDTVSLVRAARAERSDANAALGARLDSVVAMFEDARESLGGLSSVGNPDLAAAEARLIGALDRAAIRLAGDAEPGSALAQMAERAHSLLGAMQAGGTLESAAGALDVALGLLASAPGDQVAELAPVLMGPLAEVARALEQQVGELLGFLSGDAPPGGLPDRLILIGDALSQALAILDAAIESGDASLTREEMIAFTNALRTALDQATARAETPAASALPAGLRPLVELLDQLPVQLGNRIDGSRRAASNELPLEVSRTVALLRDELAALNRAEQAHPLDRLTALESYIERAIPALEAASGRSQPARALLLALQQALDTLHGPAGTDEPATAVRAALEHALSALDAFDARAGRSLFDHVAALAARLLGDTTVTAAQLAATEARFLASALARADGLSGGVAVELSTDELAALQQAINAALSGSAGALTAAGQAAGEALSAVGSPLAGAVGSALAPLSAAAGASGDAGSALRWLVQIETLRATPGGAVMLGSDVAGAARTLASAIASRALATVAEEAPRLAQLVAALRAQPEAGADHVSEDLQHVVRTVGRSVENKLLLAEPAAVIREDLRTVLSRLQRALEHLTQAADGDDPAALQQARTLLDAVVAARDALEGQQLLNASTPRAAMPHNAYVEVPVVVAGRRLQAHVKVRRDGGDPRTELDEDNATIAVRLNTETMGKVTALLEMAAGQLGVGFTLETSESARYLAERLHELDARLAESGLAVSGMGARVREDGETRDDFDRLGEPSLEPFTISVLV